MVVEDFSLTEKDKMTLRKGEWLNDLHIHIAQQLLRADFPEVGSLQTPLLHFERFYLVQRGNDSLAEVLCAVQSEIGMNARFAPNKYKSSYI